MSVDADLAQASLSRLKLWLIDKAFPLWWERGADHLEGGFHEKLSQQGQAVQLAKRARVQPRQIYSFSRAGQLGWTGDWRAAVRHGIDFYLAFYLRPDGLVRTLVATDGRPLDETAAFYDQAFALLGLHAAFATFDYDPVYRDRARRLIGEWIRSHKHPIAGFEESVPRSLPLCANPHMHLFESCLAWQGDDPTGPWRAIAAEIGALALAHFIDAKSGYLREFFAGDWSPMPGEPGRIIEPGHQFEWAWLLIRWGRLEDHQGAIEAGLRLIEIGETHGVDPRRGVAFNSLRDDFSDLDRRARLWPQTERIKAHCLAAEVTGKAQHWASAAAAAQGLMLYLDTPMPGLWWDMLTETEGFIDEPAPASSFYHIVCAIAEFDRAVAER